MVFASLGGFGSVLSAWAAVGAEIEPYRPYLLSASVGLILLSLWSLRRGGRRATASCDIRAGRLARVSILVAVLATAVAFAAPYLVFRYLVL
ncbi:MAG: hypothetical protein D6815_09375 [Candidatus Dadabacteria bacterium]|nr:MAG: hypothetical protein D6815_09375 [Candidatus Dadabacteria bacterium]